MKCQPLRGDMAVLVVLLALFSSLLATAATGIGVSYQCDEEMTSPQAFCLPASYTKQDRPNALDDEKMLVSTGFIVDDVSDVDDDSCAVTLVLIMKFSWKEDRLVSPT